MRGQARLSALGVVLLGVSAAACAGIVGADFSDVRGTSGSGISTDGGNVILPGDDAGPITPPDSGPILVDEAGMCPTTPVVTTRCGDDCFDLNTDPNNCKRCGNVCGTDPNGHGSAACANGTCTYSCPSGYEVCAGNIGCCAIAVPDGGTDSGPPVNPDILCGNTPCPFASGGFCCGDNQDSPGGDVCGDEDTQPDQLSCVYEFYCSSAAQCQSPKPACCYDTNPYDQDPTDDDNGQTSLCLSSCPSGGPYIQLCATSAECPVAMPNCTGTFNGEGQLTATYKYCQ
jgi:hypothetical protein